ncbi:MAG: peptidoglycan binding domain-containing protein [Caldilineaceae bacterium]
MGGWIDVAPRDARLQFSPDTGTINILQTSQSGRSLDVEKTAAAIQNALETGRTQAELVIDDAPPTWTVRHSEHGHPPGGGQQRHLFAKRLGATRAQY